MIRFTISPTDLLRLAVFPDGKCIRHDVVVRYIAARQYLSGSGLSYLYEKQQRMRIARISADPCEVFTPQRFIDLLESIRAKGYDPERPITLGNDWSLREGSHRVAAAVALKLPEIHVLRFFSKPGGAEDVAIYESTFSKHERDYIERVGTELCPPLTVYDPTESMWESFRARIAQNEYPPNHLFDPKTLAPLGSGNGSLTERDIQLRTYAPELYAIDHRTKGHGLLDIGSNKGFFCLALAPGYKELHGYEPSSAHAQLACDLALAHGIKNINFVWKAFADIPATLKCSVVYCGHVHHHLLDIELKQKRPLLSYVEKLCSHALDILIIDGPFDMTDITAKDVADKGGWSNEARAALSLKSHVEKAKACGFEFIRNGPSGTSTRQILVLRRVRGIAICK